MKKTPSKSIQSDNENAVFPNIFEMDNIVKGHPASHKVDPLTKKAVTHASEVQHQAADHKARQLQSRHQ